jgi:hypothetical protein
MRLFWRRQQQEPVPTEPEVAEPEVERAPEPVAPDEPPAPPEPPAGIRVSRTLVKSEPELAALVASEPRLQADEIEVSLSEKGFGTRVAIAAGEQAGLSETDLEALLDQLAEPQRRPFSNS